MSSLHLTPEQEEIVSASDGAYLVVAPPGSGKTEVIGQRIIRLLRGHPGGSFRVLALTFTKKASAAMLSRVDSELGDESRRATITTYHSFCLDVLRHYGKSVGIEANVTVYDSDDDRLQALVQGLDDEGYVNGVVPQERSVLLAALAAISRLKRDLVPPDAAPSDAMVGSISLRDAYQAYESALMRNGAIDYEGILYRTYQLLSENPRVAQHYRRLYKFILIDEAQDTSAAQYQILRILCGREHRNVLMVADPAQSIYGFSGAGAQYIRSFVQDFGAKTFRLGVNFRCSEAVLRLANRLLPNGSQGQASVLPDAYQVSAAPGHVEGYSYPDENSEAAATLDWANRMTADGMKEEWLLPGEGRALLAEDVAILARNRLQLQFVVMEFKKHGIAHHFATGDVGPFDSELYRAILYALKVLANPRDVAMRRGLLGHVPLLKTLTDEQAERLAYADVGGMFHELAEFASEPNPGWLALLDNSGREVDHLMESLVAWDSVPTASEELVELWEGDRALLSNRWREYRNRVSRADRTWAGIVLQLVDEPRADRPGFRVSTIHAAKGLEFMAVAVVGLNDGSLPDFRSKANSADLAGEKRIAYVALTRAARVLRLSRPRFRQTKYGPRVQDESPFLAEMGISLIAEDPRRSAAPF